MSMNLIKQVILSSYCRALVIIALLVCNQVSAYGEQCLNLFDQMSKSQDRSVLLERIREAYSLSVLDIERERQSLYSRLKYIIPDSSLRRSIREYVDASTDFNLKIIRVLKISEEQGLALPQIARNIQSVMKSWWSFFSSQKIVIDSRLSDQQQDRVVFNQVVSRGAHVSVIEEEFDVIVRKVSSPLDDAQLNEVDVALALLRVPNRRATLSRRGRIQFTDEIGAEKVFAVGFSGAKGFQGRHANQSSLVRYYAIVLPKGFLDKYAYELKMNPMRDYVLNRNIDEGKVFYLRRESSTQDRGQLHVQMGREWANAVFQGRILKQNQIIDFHLLAVLELSEQGEVIHLEKGQN